MEQIKKLCKIADQTRTIHGLLRDRLVLLEDIILMYVTIGSAISAMLIFASVPSCLENFIGIFIASIFIISLIPKTFDFKQKILDRSFAVRSWGKWVRESKTVYSSKNPDAIKIDILIDEYKKIMDETPHIPDKVFNKYKQKHLQKVAISKELSKTPFKKISDIKKELSR